MEDMQTLSDVLDPARAKALEATLGDAPKLECGDPLPAFFHQVYFWDPQPPDRLGRDGHPGLGGLIPDMGLPRRMWAGGELEFYAPLILGQSAERRSYRENAEIKQGRSGKLGFVTLRHEIWQAKSCCVIDRQNLVYREDSVGGLKPQAPPAAENEDFGETVTFNSTLLFRYSALTFNGHRIHYDGSYARDVEGYGGRVVHGPLLAQLLMRMAERELGKLKRFEFRATAPVMDFETAQLCWRKDGACWVRREDGNQAMIAKAS